MGKVLHNSSIFGNRRYILLPGLNHKPQQVQLPGVFQAGSQQIDPGRVDGAVPQNICQLRDIMSGLIERNGKKMPKIMGKYFGWVHLGLGAERLHGPPDLMAGEACSVSGKKDLARGDFLFSGVFYSKRLK